MTYGKSFITISLALLIYVVTGDLTRNWFAWHNDAWRFLYPVDRIFMALGINIGAPTLIISFVLLVSLLAAWLIVNLVSKIRYIR